MGRRKTTGNYATREELLSEIRGMLRLGMTWAAVARRAGVSTTTASKIFHHPGVR